MDKLLVDFFTVKCLSELCEAAKELEDPFRNVPNDILMCTLIAKYSDALFTMYSGYHPDKYFNKSNYSK